MANSGTIYSPYGNHSRFYLNWQLASQDIANNRSLINWQAGLEIQSGGWYWGSNAVKIYSVNINGSGSLGGGTWSNLSGTGQHQLISGSIWVSHNPDGTKAFSANLSGWLYGEGNEPASGSWDLPTIPRNSQVSCSASSYTLGSPVIINTNRKSDSFTHTITIRMDNSNGTVLQTINSVGASTTWTPTSDQITQMQNHIPSSNQLTLYINQHNNQVNADSNVSVTLNLTNANPTFIDFTFKDSNSTIVGITGNDQVLVKGRSILEIDISTDNKMTALKGSIADHYSFAYDGASEQEAYSPSSTVTTSFNNPQTIGNRTILVNAYDSRGNSTTITKDITVYDYVAPTIITTLTRENNFGDDTTVHIEGAYTLLNIGGTNKNSLQTGTLEYRYAEDGGSMGAWTGVGFTANTTTGAFTITDFVISLDNTKKYDFEFHISDSFGEVASSNLVDIGKPIMFVGQNNGESAVSINSMPADGAKFTIDGVNFLEFVYPVGSSYWNAIDPRNPADIFGFGTWAAIEGAVLVGKSSSSTSAFNKDAGTVVGAESERHWHWQTVSNDGGGLYSLVDGYSGAMDSNHSFQGQTKVITAPRGSINSGGGSSGGTRIDGTSDALVSKVQPSVIGYLWQRTA